MKHLYDISEFHVKLLIYTTLTLVISALAYSAYTAYIHQWFLASYILIALTMTEMAIFVFLTLVFHFRKDNDNEIN